MARYSRRFTCDLSPEDAFDYLADFSNSARWDPGVVEAKQLGIGALGDGARFVVVIEVPGPNLTLEYVVSGYERPRTLTLDAKHPLLIAHDVFTVEPLAGGSEVTYEKTVQLPGPFRLLDPIFGMGFERTAARAGRVLQEAMTAP